MTTYRKGVLFAGLPGSGKSTAAEWCADKYGGTHVQVGEEIREWAKNDGIEDPTSEELGQYAAEQREKFGGGFAMHNLVQRWSRSETAEPIYPVWVDSVRHIDGVREMEEFLSHPQLIWVEAHRLTRLERLQDRGRDDEAEFTAEDLLERDQHELGELGVATLFKHGDIDKIIENDGSKILDFKEKVDEALWTTVFDTRE